MATATKTWTDKVTVTAWKCSECDKTTYEQTDWGAPEFCSGCGAEFEHANSGETLDRGEG